MLERTAKLRADIEELPGQGVVLRLIGEIDIATVDLMADGLSQLIKRHMTDVIIDATEVTFMDSTGLHALVEGKRHIHEDGSNLILVASPAVRRVLELMFPDPLFAARVSTIEEALAIISESEGSSVSSEG